MDGGLPETGSSGAGETPLDRYFAALDGIEGWLSPTAAWIMAGLIDWQGAKGVPGGIAEIGIHHGKSFLPLAMATRDGDALHAIDCFDDQSVNIDQSGRGDRRIFEQHLSEWLPGRAVTVHEVDSLTIRGREAALGLEGLRFFSVDGSHTRAATLNDLQVADAALGPDGLCALDDMLNACFTGVISGLFDYMTPDAGLVPVALVPNKLLLARPLVRDAVQAQLRERHAALLLKSDLELGDYRIDLFVEHEGLVPSGVPMAPRPRFWQRLFGRG
ncbi:MAG: class I SAM-dependent methyltransferase [Pseudomonadota bacterium]